MHKLLKEEGERSYRIHSEIGENTIEESYDHFSKNTNRRIWLVTCNMLTTGVDLPITDSIVFLRRVTSAALAVQIIGRGVRVYPNKNDCVVLDFGENIKRFGVLDNIQFEPERTRSRGVDERVKYCEVCDTMNSIMKRKYIKMLRILNNLNLIFQAN